MCDLIVHDGGVTLLNAYALIDLIKDMHMSLTIVVCSSSKFYDDAQRIAVALRNMNFTVLTPRFDFDERYIYVNTQTKINLTKEFLKKINVADAVYVIANNGYIGMSVCFEIGYAVGRGKKIYFSEVPTEPALHTFIHDVISIDEVTSAHGTSSLFSS